MVTLNMPGKWNQTNEFVEGKELELNKWEGDAQDFLKVVVHEKPNVLAWGM